MSNYTDNTYEYVFTETSAANNIKAAFDYLLEKVDHLVLDTVTTSDGEYYTAYITSKYNNSFGICVANDYSNRPTMPIAYTYFSNETRTIMGTISTVGAIYDASDVGNSFKFRVITIGETVILYISFIYDQNGYGSYLQNNYAPICWCAMTDYFTGEARNGFIVSAASSNTYNAYTTSADGVMGTLTLTNTGGSAYPTRNQKIAVPIVGGNNVVDFYGYVGGSNPLYYIYTGNQSLTSDRGVEITVGGHTFLSFDEYGRYIRVD